MNSTPHKWTTEKTLSETLKVSPLQLEVRLQRIHTRMRGQDHWMYGSKHYRCEIWRKRIGYPDIYTFEYSQGPAHTKGPGMADLVWCLLQDANIAQNYDDEWEMAKSLGYVLDSKETYEFALATYRSCVEVNAWLTHTFSSEELDQLYELFEEY